MLSGGLWGRLWAYRGEQAAGLREERCYEEVQGVHLWEGCGVIPLFGAMGGLMVSASLMVFGLRVGDRWVAVAAGVSSAAFMAAVALIGGAL